MWSLYLSIGGVVVLLGITLPLAFHARKVSRKLGEAENENVELKRKLAEQALLMDLLLDDDPPLPELRDAARTAVQSIGGLSSLEQRAVDRFLRARATGAAGEGEG